VLYEFEVGELIVVPHAMVEFAGDAEGGELAYLWT